MRDITTAAEDAVKTPSFTLDLDKFEDDDMLNGEYITAYDRIMAFLQEPGKTISGLVSKLSNARAMKKAEKETKKKDDDVLPSDSNVFREKFYDKYESRRLTKYVELADEFDRQLDNILFGNPNGIKTMDVIETKINSLLSGRITTKEVFELVSEAKTKDKSIYMHSINVAVISCLIAHWSGMDGDDGLPVFVCGLLHDVGRLELGEFFCERDAVKESGIYRTHTAAGYKLLSKGYNSDIDIHVRNTALQHHEYYDGSGYPGRLYGTETDKYARIVCIANDYIGRIEKGISPQRAIIQMRNESRRYDPIFFDAFSNGFERTEKKK